MKSLTKKKLEMIGNKSVIRCKGKPMYKGSFDGALFDWDKYVTYYKNLCKNIGKTKLGKHQQKCLYLLMDQKPHSNMEFEKVCRSFYARKRRDELRDYGADITVSKGEDGLLYYKLNSLTKFHKPRRVGEPRQNSFSRKEGKVIHISQRGFKLKGRKIEELSKKIGIKFKPIKRSSSFEDFIIKLNLLSNVTPQQEEILNILYHSGKDGFVSSDVFKKVIPGDSLRRITELRGEIHNCDIVERRIKRKKEFCLKSLSIKDCIPRKHFTTGQKKMIMNTHGGKCNICGSTIDLQNDHRIPCSCNGETTIENGQILCRKCNQKKNGNCRKCKSKDCLNCKWAFPEKFRDEWKDELNIKEKLKYPVKRNFIFDKGDIVKYNLTEENLIIVDVSGWDKEIHSITCRRDDFSTVKISAHEVSIVKKYEDI